MNLGLRCMPAGILWKCSAARLEPRCISLCDEIPQEVAVLPSPFGTQQHSVPLFDWARLLPAPAACALSAAAGWSGQEVPEDKHGLVVYAASSRLCFEALVRDMHGGTLLPTFSPLSHTAAAYAGKSLAFFCLKNPPQKSKSHS
jgi:hypothetical protein